MRRTIFLCRPGVKGFDPTRRVPHRHGSVKVAPAKLLRLRRTTFACARLTSPRRCASPPPCGMAHPPSRPDGRPGNPNAPSRNVVGASLRQGQTLWGRQKGVKENGCIDLAGKGLQTLRAGGCRRSSDHERIQSSGKKLGLRGRHGRRDCPRRGRPSVRFCANLRFAR